MGGHEYRWNYYAHYYDVDAHRRVTPYALLRYFEDIAIMQSEEFGVGIDYYNSEQVAWLLSRWDVRIRTLPRHRDEIRVLTQPMQMRRFRLHHAAPADARWLREVLDRAGRSLATSVDLAADGSLLLRWQ